MKDTLVSFQTTLSISELAISPIVIPRIIMVDDCEPALPPVSVSIGTNETSKGITWNASSYLVSIPPVSIELIISTKSHVILFFASSNTLVFK